MFTPSIGLSTHAWNTAWRSLLLLAGFPLLLALMAFGLAVILAAGEETLPAAFARAARHMPVFLALGGAAALVWYAIALASHQRILDALAGARPVRRREEEPRLWDLTEVLCISRGERMPRLAVIETPARNAFASGLSRRTGAITVTRGLLVDLEDREVTAVLAHELAHIRGGDARLQVVAAVFSGVITLGFDVARGAGRGGWRGVPSRLPLPRPRRSGSPGRGGGRAGLIVLIGVLIMLLAAVLSVALRMALSRNREYLADAEAVRITGDPDALIAALRKVEAGPAMPALPSMLQAMLLHAPAASRGPSLWATHPPIERRVAALVRFAGGRDPGPPPAIAPNALPEGSIAEELARLRASREAGRQG